MSQWYENVQFFPKHIWLLIEDLTAMPKPMAKSNNREENGAYKSQVLYYMVQAFL